MSGGSRVRVFEAIRRDRRDDPDVSIRELAVRHGVHRRTVRQALASAEPPPRKVPVRSAPVLDPVKPFSSELGAQFGGNGAGIARCLAGRIAGVARPIVGKNRLPACQFLHHAPHTALPSPNPDCNTMVGEWPSSLTQVSSVRSRRPRRSLPEAAGAVAQPARCATARRGGVFSDQ